MKRNAFAIQSRRAEIKAKIKESGSVSVYEMSRHFDVSESTIRRDLEAIEEDGIVRFHGGMKVNGKEFGFEEKAHISSGPKEAIAEKAAEFIQNGQTIFLNAGTTTLALFRKIRNRDICIITNNVAIILEEEVGSAELILVGGQYRPRSRSLMGGMTRQNLNLAYADVSFLGANGVSVDRGLTSYLHLEAEVVRTMGERAGKVVCIADHSKIGMDAGFVSLPIERVSTLITNPAADAELLDKLRRKGLEVILSRRSEEPEL